jgi:hypothetical protein
VARRISAQNPTRRRRAGAIALARDTLQETPLVIGLKRPPHRRPSCPARGRRSPIRR